MNQFDELENFKRQVGMYFDQAMDPQSREAFLQRIESDPDCRDCFQKEQFIRDRIRQHIYRPGDPGQLIQAIKNQINKG
jgi:hypothetical protein